MASILKSLRLAADPNRLRVLLLLEQEELSVAELQEILSKGQSQISTHLSQLKQAGLVDDRRMGKNAFYRLTASIELMELFRQAAVEIPETAEDQEALRLALRTRRDNMRRYFDELAGKFGRQYVPGRSWKGIAEALLKLMPPMVIADLGPHDGTAPPLGRVGGQVRPPVRSGTVVERDRGGVIEADAADGDRRSRRRRRHDLATDGAEGEEGHRRSEERRV